MRNNKKEFRMPKINIKEYLTQAGKMFALAGGYRHPLWWIFTFYEDKLIVEIPGESVIIPIKRLEIYKKEG